MWNNKRFLGGIGVGIAIGAVLLQLANVGQSSPSVAQPDSVDERGQLPQQETKIPSGQDGQQMKPPEQQSEREVQADPEPTPETVRRDADKLGFTLHDKKEKWYTEQEVETIRNELRAQFEKEQAAVAGSGEKRTWGFAISPKSSATTVSLLLLEMGLISDRKSFESELKAQKLTGSIQSGYYFYRSKPSIGTIIRDITTPR